ncbi:hypothetical protein EZ456_23785 [Pedobacter psychrodurus]|uniref:Uncharacterized protein n=1 Tax=Pedobacter psychrodurus TaxID=2530456 RepID=A0A4R0PIN1_9SPHI|nr:hypothetical protein [Pedobacter psychrodurus]TCD16973.1 hypothetical protein EZ456_23785 [Pedobacter psychrodurus]
MKHWTEPNGNFIMNIPVDWQYKNIVFEDVEEVSPFSFEPYEKSFGCFQISCYPLSEKGINPNLPIQQSNAELEWAMTKINDEEFDVIIFYAQVDDLLCMSKFISLIANRKNKRLIEQINHSEKVLKSIRVIPKSDRKHASDLNKYDNFISSLIGSHDLLNKAYKSNSYIELVAILSNQIDAYLRLTIILHEQLINKTDDIEIKYLFQGENEKGIMERKIYEKAFEISIINEEIFKELNNLYNLRNRVIHRYIISFLKTRDIAKIAYDYTLLNETVRLILKSYEEKQIGLGFGIYGKGFSRKDNFDDLDYKRAYAMANDKHLIKELKRKL